MILIAKFNMDPLLIDCSGNTPLHMACWGGHEELARLLITKYNCPVDMINKIKQMPLHKACSYSHLGVSKMIASEFMLRSDKRINTNCNALDIDGNTPLNLLIKSGNAKAVHILFTEYSCKPHIKGAECKPLLHQLSAGGFTVMILKLISYFNHDPVSVDKDENTLLHIAAQHGQYEVVEFLITNHCDRCPIDC